MFAALVRATLLSALRVRVYAFETTVVATNKNPYISYRGPGASETLVRERMIDLVARELGLDPVEVRRRNLLRTDEQPWKMPSGATVLQGSGAWRRSTPCSSGSTTRLSGRNNGARARTAGISGSGSPTPSSPLLVVPDWWESIGFPMEKDPSRVRLEPDGRVTVITSQMPHGQGHETTLAQVAADELGVPFDHISVVTGDTSSRTSTSSARARAARHTWQAAPCSSPHAS